MNYIYIVKNHATGYTCIEYTINGETHADYIQTADLHHVITSVLEAMHG